MPKGMGDSRNPRKSLNASEGCDLVVCQFECSVHSIAYNGGQWHVQHCDRQYALQPKRAMTLHLLRNQESAQEFLEWKLSRDQPVKLHTLQRCNQIVLQVQHSSGHGESVSDNQEHNI